MHPLVKASCAVAILAAAGGPLPESSPAPAAFPSGAEVLPPAPTSLEARQPLRCPDRTLALEGRCLPLPDADAPLAGGARMQRLASVPPTSEELRMTAPHELIPRLPDRPAAYGDYQLPIDPYVAVAVPADAFSGDDAATLGQTRLGIEIIARDDQPVALVDLEGQEGQAEVVLVGDLYGVTVVVRQRVRLDSGERDYLVFYGNLDRPGPSVVNGARLGPMAVIGYIAGKDDEPTLYFEVRQERSALRGPAEHLSQLVQSGVSVAVDPRNVLPLRR